MQYRNEFASVFSNFPTKIIGAGTAQKHFIIWTAQLQRHCRMISRVAHRSPVNKKLLFEDAEVAYNLCKILRHQEVSVLKMVNLLRQNKLF